MLLISRGRCIASWYSASNRFNVFLSFQTDDLGGLREVRLDEVGHNPPLSSITMTLYCKMDGQNCQICCAILVYKNAQTPYINYIYFIQMIFEPEQSGSALARTLWLARSLLVGALLYLTYLKYNLIPTPSCTLQLSYGRTLLCKAETITLIKKLNMLCTWFHCLVARGYADCGAFRMCCNLTFI